MNITARKQTKCSRESKGRLGRLHVDDVKWNGDPVGAPDTTLGRVYFHAFSVAGRPFKVGDFCQCGEEIFRIVGAFQATASFVGYWRDRFPQEIQKQGHPYILVVPLVWLHRNKELALPVASTKLSDGGHIDMLPQWLGEANVATMVKLPIHVGLNKVKKRTTRNNGVLVCNQAMTGNGRRMFCQPLTDEQKSLLTCLPHELLERHVVTEWNAVFRAERVRLVHSKHSHRGRSRLPQYYTADSSDDEEDDFNDACDEDHMSDFKIDATPSAQTDVSQLKSEESRSHESPQENELKRTNQHAHEIVSPVEHVREACLDDSFSSIDAHDLFDTTSIQFNESRQRTETSDTKSDRSRQDFTDAISPTKHVSEGFLEDSFSPTDFNLLDGSGTKGPPRKRAEIKYNDAESPIRHVNEGFLDDSFSPTDFLNLVDVSNIKGPPRTCAEIKYKDIVSPNRHISDDFLDVSISPTFLCNSSAVGKTKSPPRNNTEAECNQKDSSVKVKEEFFHQLLKSAGVPNSPVCLLTKESATLSISNAMAAETINNSNNGRSSSQASSYATLPSPINMSIPISSCATPGDEITVPSIGEDMSLDLSTVRNAASEFSVSNISTTATLATTALAWRKAHFLPKKKMNALRREAKAAKANRIQFFNTKNGKILRLKVSHHILHHVPGKSLYCTVCGYSDKTNRRQGHRSCFRCKTCGYVPLCTRIRPGYANSCWTDFHSMCDLQKRRPSEVSKNVVSSTDSNKVKENKIDVPKRAPKRLLSDDSIRRRTC